VEERTDGRMIIKHNGKSLEFKGIMEKPTIWYFIRKAT
jgi:hypothetical protein